AYRQSVVPGGRRDIHHVWLDYGSILWQYDPVVITEQGAGLQNPRILALGGPGPGSASNTETRPALGEGAAAGAVNGRYNPRARGDTRVGLNTPALLLLYH